MRQTPNSLGLQRRRHAMAGGDWLRLYRKSLSSRVFSDPWLWHLWSWCLLKASWKTCWKSGRQLLPGQFATNKREAAQQLNTSSSRIYRGLKTLQEWGQIRVTVNRWFTVITLCNWEVYQCETNQGGTGSGPEVDRKWTGSGPPTLVEEGKEGEEGGSMGGPGPPKPPDPPSARHSFRNGRSRRRQETLAQQIARQQQERQRGCSTGTGQDG
jgi:hypothetical protein